MQRLETALLERSRRGTAVGPDLMIMRVNQELADEAPFVASDLRRLQGSPPRPRRRGWAFALGLLVGAIAVGLPLWLLGGARDTVDEPATTLPATTAAPPTTVLPMLDVWQRVGIETMAPVSGLFDMAPVGRELVAVGFDVTEDDRFTGAVFRSDDWVTWERSAEGDAALETGNVFMYGVIEGGPGLVAVGMGCEPPIPCSPHPTVWTTSDGNVWTRSESDPAVFGEQGAMLDIVARDSGLLAVGNIEERAADGGFLARPAVWSSANGVDWSRAWEGDPIVGADSMLLRGINALTVGSDGLLVGVGMAQDAAGALVAAVWTSPDGRSWERVADTQAFAAAGGGDIQMIDVTSGSKGFLAVGTEGGAVPAVWHSPDGHIWSRVDTTLQPFSNVASLGSVTGLPSGYLVAGPDGFRDRHGGAVTLWTSPDGLSWDRVATQGAGYAAAIVSTERGIALAGSVPGEVEPHASVWVGPSFDPADPPSDPQPADLAPPAESTTSQASAAVLSCRELAERGYSYGRVAAYWRYRHLYSDLDPDGNGVPCEAEYQAEDVTALYGSPGGQAVSLSFYTHNHTFTAEGAAIDDGLFCPSGTVIGTGDQGEDQPQFADSLFRGDDNIYVCADGSGEFMLAMEFFFESSRQVIGVWWILEGAGAYESLVGGGTYVALNEGTDPSEIVGRIDQASP